MLNYIWSAMILVSVVSAVMGGNCGRLCTALCDGAAEGVSLAIGMAGIMAFWTGLMKVAEKSGLVGIIARGFSFFIARLFPEAKKDKEVCGSIAMNMTANLFGMGNAATPLGINAMKKLSQYSAEGRASPSMCMLAVINCASLQLVPSTLIALRSAMGSHAPTEIIVPIWIASAVTFASGVILCRLAGGRT